MHNGDLEPLRERRATPTRRGARTWHARPRLAWHLDVRRERVDLRGAVARGRRRRRRRLPGDKHRRDRRRARDARRQGTKIVGPSFIRRWLLAYFRWTWQRIVVSVPHHPDRAAGRRMDRAGFDLIDGYVKVMRLRRTVELKAHGERWMASTSDHQWIVRGHWRRQWYRSLGPARLPTAPSTTPRIARCGSSRSWPATPTAPSSSATIVPAGPDACRHAGCGGSGAGRGATDAAALLHQLSQRAIENGVARARCVDLQNIGAHAQTWEKVVTKLRTASMPPAGGRGPTRRPTRRSRPGSKASSIARPPPPESRQRPPLHRLNRAEYKNAVRDLLGARDLPRSWTSTCCCRPTTRATGSTTSPTCSACRRRCSSAISPRRRRSAALAVGDPSMPLIVDTYRMPPELPQDDRFDGLPFGTRGGISIRRYFPARRRVRRSRSTLDGGADRRIRTQLEVSIDGERVQVFTVGGAAGGRGRGGRRAGAPDRRRARRSQQAPRRRSSRVDRQGRPSRRSPWPSSRRPRRSPRTISGRSADRARATRPAAVAGERHDQRAVQRRRAGDTPSRRRIFACQPVDAADRSRTALRETDPLDAGAPRLPAAGDRRGSAGAAAVLSTAGRAERRLRARHPAGARAAAGQPGVPVPRRARPARRRRRDRRTGSATSSWPRACRSSSGAAFPTTSCSIWPQRGKLTRPGGARAAGAADARRSARRGARQQLRRPVAVPAQRRRRDARSAAVPRLRREPAARDAARDRAVLREHRPRGPQRARAADRRLHVRQRAAGASTTASRTSTATNSGA